jgi:cytidylate kinase
MEVSQVIVEKLLDKESLIKDIEKRLSHERPFKPFLTFSREPGSGGKPIAREVAKRLGYTFYDKHLIEQVAQKMKVSSKVLSSIDEHRRTGVMDFVQNMFNPDYVSDESYFRNLVQVVLQLIQKGGVVILGRGANFTTPKAFGLQVQVVAPYRVRVARAIEFENVDFNKAREIIREVGADREGFVKQYIGKDIHQPKYYDLTINTTFFSIQAAVDVVLCAFEKKFPKAKPGQQK